MYDTYMIQVKFTNVNALGGMANQRIVGDWTGNSLGTYSEKLRHGKYNTRIGLRLSKTDPQAQLSDIHRNTPVAYAAATWAVPLCLIQTGAAPFITHAQ